MRTRALLATLLGFGLVACGDRSASIAVVATPPTTAAAAIRNARATVAATEPVQALGTFSPPARRDRSIGVWVIDMQSLRPTELYREPLGNPTTQIDVRGEPRFTAGGDAIWITRKSTNEAVRYDLAGRVTDRITGAWDVRESPVSGARWYRRFDAAPVVEYRGQRFELPSGVFDASLSPDGLRLAYVQRGRELKYDAAILDLTSTTTHTIARDLNLVPTHQPASGSVHWSPSGRYVSLYDWQMPPPSAVVVFDATTGALTRYAGSHAIWSPRDDVLLIQEEYRQALAYLETGATHTLSEFADISPTFTRDGTVVVWHNMPQGGGPSKDWEAVALRVADRQEIGRWPDAGPARVGMFEGQPVLAVRMQQMGECGTALVHPHLPSEYCLGRALVGAWAPDGTRFVFVRQRRLPGSERFEDQFELIVFETSTQSERSIGVVDDIPTLDWSADGTHLLVVWPQFGP